MGIRKKLWTWNERLTLLWLTIICRIINIISESPACDSRNPSHREKRKETTGRTKTSCVMLVPGESSPHVLTELFFPPSAISLNGCNGGKFQKEHKCSTWHPNTHVKQHRLTQFGQGIDFCLERAVRLFNRKLPQETARIREIARTDSF